MISIGGHSLSDGRQRREPANIASDRRWRHSYWARIADYAVTAIFLNIHIPSRGLHHNYVIRDDKNIYKMETGALAVIAAGYVIVNEERKREKDVDGSLRTGCYADPV